MRPSFPNIIATQVRLPSASYGDYQQCFALACLVKQVMLVITEAIYFSLGTVGLHAVQGQARW